MAKKTNGKPKRTGRVAKTPRITAQFVAEQLQHVNLHHTNQLKTVVEDVNRAITSMQLRVDALQNRVRELELEKREAALAAKEAVDKAT